MTLNLVRSACSYLRGPENLSLFMIERRTPEDSLLKVHAAASSAASNATSLRRSRSSAALGSSEAHLPNDASCAGGN